MKNLTTFTLTISATILLSACGGSNTPSPSQNAALNSVSSSSATKKPGLMQNSLDSWLKDDWTPTVEKDENIRKKYMKTQKDENVSKSNTQKEIYVEDSEKDFTLQEYVDKAGVYIKAHKNDKKESNVKKLNSMPVIGN